MYDCVMNVFNHHPPLLVIFELCDIYLSSAITTVMNFSIVSCFSCHVCEWLQAGRRLDLCPNYKPHDDLFIISVAILD